MLQTYRVRPLDQVRAFLDGAEPVEVQPLDRSALRVRFPDAWPVRVLAPGQGRQGGGAPLRGQGERVVPSVADPPHRSAPLKRRASTRLPSDPLLHDHLFGRTKDYYRADDLFTGADRLEISEETFRRIVKELERFDLSKTGDDVEGFAFEKFLGSTFRGELGQFFTPRPVVDFMVSLLDPREGELICDPAAVSGGFLIRAFEHVRARIAADVQAEKDRARAEIEAQGLAPEEEESQVDAAFAALNRELLASNDHNRPADTRVGRLAWQCIFGCDAEPRAARTAKMNMIMHGDGHGGIHYHDGLVDVNGIFPSRFDIVVTNPPFGSNVGSDQKIGGSDETRIHEDEAYLYRSRARYGEAWEQSYRRMRDAAGTNILDLFEIGRGEANRATEIVFVERCLGLLKPGGRLGIVLPDGNLNNPSLTWLRRWCEGKARIAAVVSLPEETFRSADAVVRPERNQLGDGAIVPGDDEALPRLHALQKLWQMCFRFGYADFGHGQPPGRGRALFRLDGGQFIRACAVKPRGGESRAGGRGGIPRPPSARWRTTPKLSSDHRCREEPGSRSSAVRRSGCGQRNCALRGLPVRRAAPRHTMRRRDRSSGARSRPGANSWPGRDGSRKVIAS